MEAKQFAELLKSPLQVAQLPADALRELVNRYPFSASLQMLLLKQYQLNDHPAYDEQLPKAAVYAPDRRALYRLVQLREVVVPKEELTPETEIIEVEETIEQPLVEEDVADTPTVIDAEPLSYAKLEKQISDEEPLFTEEEIVSIETETPPYAEAPAETEQTESTAPEQLEAVSFTPPVIPEEHFAGMQQDEAETVEETTTEALVDNEAPEVGAVTEQEAVEIVEEETIEVEVAAIEEELVEETQAETEVAEAKEPEPVAEEVTEEAVAEVVVEEPVAEDTVVDEATVAPAPKPMPQTDSFAGWLQRIKRHEVPTAPKPMDAEDLQEKAALDALFGAGTYEATLVQESNNLPEEEPAKHKPTPEELMEPDDEANRRMDAQAKKSLTMGEELVTETLARIYEIQKKTAKAIEAYEILKVRFPEKTEHFNAKIQALREI